MVFLRSLPDRTSSASSAGPEVPSNVVNGARSGLVTGSLAIIRLSLWVATAVRAVSQGLIRSGSGVPDSRTAAVSAATTPPYTDIAAV